MTGLELEAAKFRVLNILHTNNPNITFHVFDVYNDFHDVEYLKSQLTQKDFVVDENTIFVRGSFFNDKGVELAAVHALDASDKELLNHMAYDLGEGFEFDRKRKQSGETNGKS